MFLEAVKAALVYAVSAGVALWLTHRCLRPLRRDIALALVLLPCVLTGPALLRGRMLAPIDIYYQTPPLKPQAAARAIAGVQNPILSDVAYSMIPWRKATREAIKHGRLPLWNRFNLAGEPLLAVQQHGILHPTAWPGLLLPLATGWTVEMTLRLFLAGLCAYLYFRELELSELSALLGAAGWALCDFLVFYLGYPLAPAIGPFPLLLLGLRLLARHPGARAVGVTILALFLATAAGHPESLLHVTAAGGVSFLFELGWSRRRSPIRSILLAILAGGVTLGLSAILLLPLFEALPLTWEQKVRDYAAAVSPRSVPLREALGRLESDFLPYVNGEWGQSQINMARWGPAGYCGTALLPLAFVGLFSRRKEKWPFLLLGVLGLALHARAPVISDFVSRLPLFRIAINDRLAFLLAFGIVGLAALGLDRILNGEGRSALLAGAIGTVLLLAASASVLWPGMKSLGLEAVVRQRLPIQLAAPLFLILAFVLLRWRPKSVWVGIGILVLLLAQRRWEEGKVYPDLPAEAFAPRIPVLDPIPRGAPYRFTALGYLFVPNIAGLYELEDVRGYESMTLLEEFQTYPLWCVGQPVWYNRVDDPTRAFLSFLNVQYVLIPENFVPPAGWQIASRGDGTILLKNPKALERVFVPRQVGFEPGGTARLQTLAGVADFGERGIVGEPAPAGAARWIENGRASVRIADYSAQAMTLDIDAQASSVIGTSVVAWPGWKLKLDGSPVRLLSYNHAFVGFRVPPGRHRAVLTYWPDSVTNGLWVSGATLALLLGWAARSRVGARRFSKGAREADIDPVRGSGSAARAG